MFEYYIVSVIVSFVFIYFYNFLIEKNKYAFISILKDLHYTNFSPEIFSILKKDNCLTVLDLLSETEQKKFKTLKKINLLKSVLISIFPVVNIIISWFNLFFLFIDLVTIVFENKDKNSFIYKLNSFFTVENLCVK